MFPTTTLPFIVGNINLYSDRIEYKDDIIFLDSISIIGFKAGMQTLNFSTKRLLIFIIDGNLNGKDVSINIANPISNKVLFPSPSKETFEKLIKLNDYISKFTFEKRLNKYLNQLRKENFFIYQGYQFYVDGTIKKGSKVYANIINANKQNLLGFGTKYQGLRSNSYNPYDFVITSGAPKISFFGFSSGFSLKIEAIIDFDVFFYLIDYLVTNNKYPN